MNSFFSFTNEYTSQYLSKMGKTGVQKNVEWTNNFWIPAIYKVNRWYGAIERPFLKNLMDLTVTPGPILSEQLKMKNHESYHFHLIVK